MFYCILQLYLAWIHININSFIPESNATILAQSAKNVKLGSYEKLQKIKS